MDIQTIEDAVCHLGLDVLGGFHGDKPDEFATIVLIGNAGPDMWAAFTAATSPDERAHAANPLDDWTRRGLSAAADGLSARALFPFDGPPYHPFQQWALRTGSAFVSPTGPLIHPIFGLWHAYRGALAFEDRLDLAPPPGGISPCLTCADKPCLGACPVNAFSLKEAGERQDVSAEYDVAACVAHIGSPAGGVCFKGGCLARHACPVGREFAYREPQANFHMVRFLKAQGDL
ncbi:MAG: hypothetical protein O7E53_06455 [Alphaproteobacteria bacterium]|nr:hypothetical protein [Alphaproteobacteria bacterium]